MNSWAVAPVILPGSAAAIIVLVSRSDPVLQRRLALLASVLGLLLAIGLLAVTAKGDLIVYRLGAWPMPFGIALVLDRLAAAMVLLTAILGLAVTVYACGREDQNGPHFHALLQFQLMGLNGAFLTGDLFNLFVFFELLLIASYGLMLHGGGLARFANGFQYVSINLLGSLLFLVAAGLLYGVTGTLNMADLAVKAALIAPGDEALLRVGGTLLLLVFALKAALVPLHFWLPGAYRSTSGTSAAMFAIMTKVGAYAIIRTGGLIFGTGGGAAAGLYTPWLLPAGLLTVALGLGALPGAVSMGNLAAFALIGSTGMLFIGIALGQADGIAAALFYLVHSTLASAALFLVVDQVRSGGDGDNDWLRGRSGMAGQVLLGAVFMVLAIAMVGLPPFSGFLGKLFILRASLASPWWALIFAVVLLGSFAALIGFARAGIVLFWEGGRQPAARLDSGAMPARGGPRERRDTGPKVVIAGLLLGLALLTVGAGPALRFFTATAESVLTPGSYIDAVLGPAVRARQVEP